MVEFGGSRDVIIGWMELDQNNQSNAGTTERIGETATTPTFSISSLSNSFESEQELI